MATEMGLEYMTIYEVDAKGRPHGRTETVRLSTGTLPLPERVYCYQCYCYHDGFKEEAPGIKSLISVGQYLEGKRHGTWKQWPTTCPDDTISPDSLQDPWITLNYDHGVPNGPVKLFYSIEKWLYTDTFTLVDGIVQGERVIKIGDSWAPHYELVCNYVDGQLHGCLTVKVKTELEDGNYMRVTKQEYHKGEVKGNRITYMHPLFGRDRRPILHSVIGVKGGHLHGPLAIYYPSHSRRLYCVANYQNGILKGRFRRWNERGELVMSHNFTGEEYYEAEQEYEELMEQMETDLLMTSYEVSTLNAHIKCAADPEHESGLSNPHYSHFEETGLLVQMYSGNSALSGLKFFDGYFSSLTRDDYYEEGYNGWDDYDEDRYSYRTEWTDDYRGRW